MWVEKNKLITPSILHIKPNIFRKQSDDSMCDFKCITFIECMIVGKTLLDYTNYFLLMPITEMTRLYISNWKKTQDSTLD